MNRPPAFHPFPGLRFPPQFVDSLYDGMSGARVHDDERDGDPRESPPRFAEAYRDQNGGGWKEESEAHNPKPQFPGDGQSRTLQTQSGATARLLQSAMFQEGGVYTIVFDVKYPVGLIFRAVGVIRWSENGNTVTRMFDIVKGLQISTPGRVLDVSVIDATPLDLPLITGDGGAPVPTPGAGTDYTVTAIVERGNRAAESRPPTLFGGSAILGSHASETVAIPYQAGVISLEVTASEQSTFPTVQPNILVSFTTASGGIFKQYSVTADSGFVPIPPGATEVTITNADPANGAIVGITWGVDG